MFIKRLFRGRGTVPLIAYWTRMYVLVLLLCLLALAVISGVWIKVNTYSHRYDLLEMRAEQLAEEYGQKLESGVPPDRLQHTRAFKVGPATVPVLVQISLEPAGLITVANPRYPISPPRALYALSPRNGEVMAGATVREEARDESQTWLRVGEPIYIRGSVGGALYASLPTRSILDQVRRLYESLALIIATIGLAGWLVLYFLSRKLTRPLLQVAAAAQGVARGEYNPDLPSHLRELELQQLVVSFRDMASQLQQLERLRSDLLAGVSHELRTPVTSIRGMIQAVKDRVVTGEQAEEFLGISLQETKRLQMMVEDLLDFSYLESGAAPIESEGVNLSRLVEEVARQVAVLPEFSGVRLDLDLPPGEVWAPGDPGRIRQVLLNLLNNSLRASATGILITLREAGDRVVLDLRDNGRGIDPADQPYIFERFYRGRGGRGKPRGLGLGLTVSRLLARAHGGDLTLLETSPEGTVFSITLPGPGSPGENAREGRPGRGRPALSEKPL